VEAEAPFAIVRPVRPVLRYEAEDARFTGARLVAEPAGHSGSGAVELRGGGSLLEWTVVLGVGDRYGLSLRYATASPVVVPAELSLLASDGTLLHREAVELKPEAPGAAWGTLRTTTGTSLNAGSYRVRLAPRGEASVVVDVLEVE
jgi:hypothetical protein